MIGDANIMTILVAAIAGMVVGAVWYSPKLFRGAWMKYSGVNRGDIKKANEKGMRKMYLMAFIGHIVTAYVLSYFIGHPGMASIGAAVGLWAWLGFVAPVHLGMVLWEGKPMQYFWINTLHALVTLLVMGMVIAAWS